MKRGLSIGRLVVVFGVVQLAGLQAEAVSISGASSPNLTIPDNDLNGVADTISLSTLGTSVAGVSLTLDINGGYNGDFYAYLRHGDSGFAMLLNRVGQDGANPFGYAGSGFEVSFSDLAANGDIHAYQDLADPAGSKLIGVWQPDGRRDSLSTAREAMLSSFNGQDPNGDWTLFVSDLSTVGIGTLAEWSLSIEVTSPPPPTPDGGASTLSLAVVALTALAGLKGRAKTA